MWHNFSVVPVQYHVPYPYLAPHPPQRPPEELLLLLLLLVVVSSNSLFLFVFECLLHIITGPKSVLIAVLGRLSVLLPNLIPSPNDLCFYLKHYGLKIPFIQLLFPPPPLLLLPRPLLVSLICLRCKLLSDYSKVLHAPAPPPPASAPSKLL
jgi:hypothetical protein